MSAISQMFVDQPPSLEIVDALNAVNVDVCQHNRNPCYLRCGVRKENGMWLVIPHAERLVWRDEVETKIQAPEALTLPCGCTRGIIKRQAPTLNDDGTAKIENGVFVMEEIEELQEHFCPEHANVVIERQHAVQKALADGATAEEATRLLMGASPFPMLEDGGE